MDRSLPSGAYLSASSLTLDRDRFFARSWTCVGRIDDVAAPGDQRAVRAGPETILLVRANDGVVRAFYNVCRHRAHELLGAGDSTSGSVVRCPYHGWSYSLDGSLMAPKTDGCDGLGRVPLAEWHGWLFVNVTGDAPDFARHVGNLSDVVAQYEPRRLVAAARHHYTVAANWKVVVENYHECYHCARIHPELTRVSPPSSGSSLDAVGSWVGGPMDLASHATTMSFSGESAGAPLRGLDQRARRVVHYIQVFPNLLLSLHPDYVMTHRLEPVEPGSTEIECTWLFPPEAFDVPGFDPAYAVDFWDRTNRQDWSACESVQRGIASRGYRPGPLTEREKDVARFLSMVRDAYRPSSSGLPGCGFAEESDDGGDEARIANRSQMTT